MKNIVKYLLKICSILLVLIVYKTNLSAQSRISVSGELEHFTYPAETPGWIDFKSGNKLNPENVFVNNFKEFGLTPDDNMKLMNVITTDWGMTHFKYQQYYKDRTVDGGDCIVHFNGRDVTSINGFVAKNLEVNTDPALSEQSALATAINIIGKVTYLWEVEFYENNIKETTGNPNATYFPKGELMIVNSNVDYSNNRNNKYVLAWVFEIWTRQTDLSRRIFINANDGSLIKSLPIAHSCSEPTPAMLIQCQTGSGNTVWNGNRTIYTEWNGVPHPLDDYVLSRICLPNDPTKLQVLNQQNDSLLPPVSYHNTDNTWTYQPAIQSFWSLSMAYKYYKDVWSRESYIGIPTGAPVTLLNDVPNSVFFTSNASWGPDGFINVSFNGNAYDNDNYNTLDIIGHEFTHGVTNFSVSAPNGLAYQNESGALNESFSDIFGELIEYHTLGTIDWFHGADRGANRILSDPDSLGQPDTYMGTNWVSTIGCTPMGGNGGNDFCGVHTNSGVQNFWFFLLANGGTDTNDLGQTYNVGAAGLGYAEDIAYSTLTGYLTQYSQYIDARAGSIHMANDKWGTCSSQSIQVAQAWYAVGVGSQSPANNATICGTLNSNYYGITSVENNCSSTVNSGVTANMSALTLVKLNPPFYANSGSTFRAYLGEPCALASYRSVTSTFDSENEKINDLTINSNLSVNPNPFNNKTNISYTLMQNEKVDLKIYNLQMQLVKTLISASSQKEGKHSIEFNADDLSNGIYFCCLKTGDQVTYQKIIITR